MASAAPLPFIALVGQLLGWKEPSTNTTIQKTPRFDKDLASSSLKASSEQKIARCLSCPGSLEN